MKKRYRLLHSIIVMSLVLAMWLGLAVMYFGLMVEVFEDQVTPNQPTWMMFIIMAALLTLGAGIVGIARKVRWPWLTSGIVAVCVIYGFLAHDAPPPPPINLGVRVGNDDPTHQTIMWLSDKAPSSRLKEADASSWNDPDLLLPDNSDVWTEFLQKNETKILKAWDADHMGREWIDKLSSTFPKGVWQTAYDAPYLNFKPVRYTYKIHLARAVILARAGQHDDALMVVDKLLRAAHHLERSSPGLLHQTIATVLKKLCYLTANEILD